jgi:hypothetical protein
LRAEGVLVKVATKIAGQAPGVLPLFTRAASVVDFFLSVVFGVFVAPAFLRSAPI